MSSRWCGVICVWIRRGHPHLAVGGTGKLSGGWLTFKERELRKRPCVYVQASERLSGHVSFDATSAFSYHSPKQSHLEARYVIQVMVSLQDAPGRIRCNES